MALAKTYQPWTRLGHEEADGLINVLEHKVAELGEDGDIESLYYTGALFTMTILRYHEFVDVPDDFMRLFEHYLHEAE